MLKSQKKIKILIVESSLLLLGLYKKKLILSRDWYVKVASNLKTAIEVCRAFKPDLIILGSSLIKEEHKRSLADLTLGSLDKAIPVIIIGPLDLPKEFICVKDTVLGFVDMAQNDLNDLIKEVEKVLSFKKGD